jgi:hypothetical protein
LITTSPRDPFSTISPAAEMKNTREFVANDYDPVPNVSEDHPSAARRAHRRSLSSINRDQRVPPAPTPVSLDQRHFKKKVMEATRNSFVMAISS